ncbi:MAG TPA: zinc ABC transporter substrate-binding protein [Methanosarcinaceae archaeon]|nr:zinc ABC transporter substrate-binding protein [Methanosarcinaceae archaeon]
MNKKIVLVLVLIITAFLGNGCINQVETQNDDDRIVILVSILPQADFVGHIGGDKVNVIVMIPPGANPATYEPTASQLKSASNADMYVKVGSGLPFEEVWLDNIGSANPDMLIVDTSEGVDLISGDPHIWLSPRCVVVQVENIYKGLVQVDTVNRKFYNQNKEDYIHDLEVLDNDLNESLSGFKNHTFMVFHPSWGYFARDYDLTMIAVEIEGKEPSAGVLARLVETAKENNIKIIFVQPQFSTKSAEVIANEIGASVVSIDPLPQDFIKDLRTVSGIFSQDPA